MAGPLTGVKIVEFAGQGAAPFAAMMLADHGADVTRICRMGAGAVDPSSGMRAEHDVLLRSRRTLEIDLSTEEGQSVARDIVAASDGLIEGFRPGVMERLGLGPDQLLKRNPRLVYGRMTGWGQTGINSGQGGHDINYIAATGALHACGRAGAPPVPPLNLVGDFGGGGMLLAFAMVSAILSARGSGEGQVIDCAMTDGSALLMSMIWSLHAERRWQDERGANMLDGGAPFYRTYETADGKYLAVGAIEEKFHAALIEALGLPADPDGRAHWNPSRWPEQHAMLEAHFRTRTRDQWCAALAEVDCCVTPVLSLAEVASHPVNMGREAYLTIDDVVQPAPAPRYSRSTLDRPRMSGAGEDPQVVLKGLGYSEDEIERLVKAGVLGGGGRQGRELPKASERTN
ncbi:CaiB/BaiF CoA-transferase family protein [Sphingobium sp.]|uniref:CaiB/BaiF CoA transferase family protein n=1 Tax=Sphingobium sp. TaxID=1912891 RepID=UPI0028BEE638|nr:CaiB/BaiF CoA-transferase family protein [Sphingobium sp.]